MNIKILQKSIFCLITISALAFGSTSGCIQSYSIHPVYSVLLDNQTDQVLNIYHSGYFVGKVEPRKIIIVGWDTHSSFIEIVAKNLAGETVFSDTYSERNLTKREVYFGVIPPLTTIPTSNNISQNK
jgi:hypothetical protein